MPTTSWSSPSRQPLPLILIRGFGGLDTTDLQRSTYQGFNDGTVYRSEHKQGTNYIYEGMILRLIKSDWRYQDATNVVTYYSSEFKNKPEPLRKLEALKKHLNANSPSAVPPYFEPLVKKKVVERFTQLEEKGFFYGDRVVIDPSMALQLIESVDDPRRSIWVFRYYDLADRKFETYGKALVRLIDFIRELALMQDGTKPKVNIVAHSMGGLLVRQAIQMAYPERVKAWEEAGRSGETPETADDCINKIVTLGTPHRGISFQILKNWISLIQAENEIEHFNPEFQADRKQPASFWNFEKHFPLDRLLTVVGTDYRSFNIKASAIANRFFSVADEYDWNYNRSDGLVKQTSAQIPGAPRTFIHKSHGGDNSIVTSRESFEVVTRFLFGNVQMRLRLISGKITRGKDFFGKSEFFFGVSVKPRRVDFELFHQSKEAENCYGPFSKLDEATKDISFQETNSEIAFPWADDDKLIWEGYLDTSPIINDPSITLKDMVLRFGFYVGERDLLGIGFSDNVVFYKQYYARVLLDDDSHPTALYLHTGEEFASEEFKPTDDNKMKRDDRGWLFDVGGTGFQGTFRLEMAEVPPDGHPVPL